MLCSRLRDRVVREQSVDQAAYRPGYSTIDHLMSTTFLFEACRNYNVEVWAAMVDFEKAFDTVEHDTLWKALEQQCIPIEYINVLKR
eukprot:7944848-Pyramimonas_sp.AAC.1